MRIFIERERESSVKTKQKLPVWNGERTMANTCVCFAFGGLVYWFLFLLCVFC